MKRRIALALAALGVAATLGAGPVSALILRYTETGYHNALLSCAIVREAVARGQDPLALVPTDARACRALAWHFRTKR